MNFDKLRIVFINILTWILRILFLHIFLGELLESEKEALHKAQGEAQEEYLNYDE